MAFFHLCGGALICSGAEQKNAMGQDAVFQLCGQQLCAAPLSRQRDFKLSGRVLGGLWSYGHGQLARMLGCAKMI
eukprot:1146197-Pelagomonas_calceolata.AAC.2